MHEAMLICLQWCETENPMWGLTTNPLNPKFTPGGSTGGEGALLALHGSLIGMGTDIGGSIRIPSHMNGLWGLKPTVRPDSSTIGRVANKDPMVELQAIISRSSGIDRWTRACALVNRSNDSESLILESHHAKCS